LKIIVLGEPVVKPRMTRRDKWMLRPCVSRYREYQDRIHAAIYKARLHLQKPQPPVSLAVEFFVSTSRGVDLSNLVKSTEEALHPILLEDDSIDFIPRYDFVHAHRVSPARARTEITIEEMR
jgi:Holliday junction resolvase RusA-like endonuclease